MMEACGTRNFIVLKGTVQNSLNCILVNIYCPCCIVGRRNVWSSLLNLKPLFTDPWCIGGDFNEVRNPDERQGCISRNNGMIDFNNFIEDMELVDLSMLGRKFTWSNYQDGEKWSRLDRILVHKEWLEHFKLKLWGLPRTISDHCPILLMEDESNWGPKPFKFYNFW